jgi:hypothetical protein
MFIYYLVVNDDEPIKRFIRSPYGSKCADRVIPLAYRKIIQKSTKPIIIKELWRHAIKKLTREIIRNLPRTFGIDLIGKIKMLAASIFRYFHANGYVPEGLYIFADLERLPGEDLIKAEDVRTILMESGSRVRVLNSPAHSMRRYDVLRTLHEHGINDFKVYRWSDGEQNWRYPVLLRYENGHNVFSSLIPTRQILDYEFRHAEETGRPLEHLLIVEFCDTADRNGIYRRYNAFVVGDRVFPRNLCFSRKWLLKRWWEMGDDELLANKELIAEEEAYVRMNPHADIIRKIFSLTKIEYGRIDYSMVGDSIRVWEINTNPHITYEGSDRGGLREWIHDYVEQTMLAALMSLSSNYYHKD